MQGIIIENISNQYKVKVEQEIFVATARGKFKINDITPVVGDKVEIEITDKEKQQAVIVDVLDRTNYIKRPKIANLTKLVFVVSGKMPKPDLLLLDKQLAFAEYLQLSCFIVLNKMDLEKEEELEKIAKIYRDIGYPVILTNAKQKVGLEQVKEALKGEISAFSGNSGVGKSTLLNALFEENMTLEGEISNKNKKGKNTTTCVSLYDLGENTYIADTPGFSTFDITEIEAKDLWQYFREFVPYEKNCEFVGCTHIKEQSCGIKEQLLAGNITKSRYDNYQRIYEDLKEKEEHKW